MTLLHYLLFGLTVVILLALVWLSQRRRLSMEADYRRRLEKEVRERTGELARRNDELKHANDQLLEASLTDPLTGLRNRRFLFEEISRHVGLVRRWHEKHGGNSAETESFNIVLLMIDLDQFKPVNDRCGHTAGDQVLLRVRDVLKTVCRSSDFVIRWGGDEFVIVSRNVKPDAIATLAERVRCDIERTVFELDDGQIVRLTASIGFACFPFVLERPELVTWEQVLGIADSALYLAKKRRNAWVGYFSTTGGLEPQRLVGLIRNKPMMAREQGLLDIRASFSIALPETTDPG